MIRAGRGGTGVEMPLCSYSSTAWKSCPLIFGALHFVLVNNQVAVAAAVFACWLEAFC